MANNEHVAMLRMGVDAWDEWRSQQLPAFVADLREADLSGALLSEAYLVGAHLNGANLSGANLSEAELRGAHLNAANLNDANLVAANLRGANLRGANLNRANLFAADLREANLSDANLTGAKLFRADLLRANLRGADLSAADLSEAGLRHTVFGSTSLSGVKGLDLCRHEGPSIIDFATLSTLRISDPLPTAFLRGVGLSENVIDYLPSLLNTAIQHYSCFISYSSKDQAFADRLHADLQNKGVRCWFAPHDMRIGAKIIDAIEEAIRVRDKVLLILSESAIASDWVEGEVTRALDEERTRNQVVLFPVRLDDVVMQTSEGWARLLRGQRNIGDFTGWKEQDSYQKSFERLMRDLRVEKPGQ